MITLDESGMPTDSHFHVLIRCCMLLATVYGQEKQYESCEGSEDVPGNDVVPTKIETVWLCKKQQGLAEFSVKPCCFFSGKCYLLKFTFFESTTTERTTTSAKIINVTIIFTFCEDPLPSFYFYFPFNYDAKLRMCSDTAIKVGRKMLVADLFLIYVKVRE